MHKDILDTLSAYCRYSVIANLSDIVDIDRIPSRGLIRNNENTLIYYYSNRYRIYRKKYHSGFKEMYMIIYYYGNHMLYSKILNKKNKIYSIIYNNFRYFKYVDNTYMIKYGNNKIIFHPRIRVQINNELHDWNNSWTKIFNIVYNRLNP